MDNKKVDYNAWRDKTNANHDKAITADQIRITSLNEQKAKKIKGYKLLAMAAIVVVMGTITYRHYAPYIGTKARVHYSNGDELSNTNWSNSGIIRNEEDFEKNALAHFKADMLYYNPSMTLEEIDKLATGEDYKFYKEHNGLIKIIEANNDISTIISNDCNSDGKLAFGIYMDNLKLNGNYDNSKDKYIITNADGTHNYDMKALTEHYINTYPAEEKETVRQR